MIQRPLLLFLAGITAGMASLASGEPLSGQQSLSLVNNGDFEEADALFPAQPAGWQRTDGLGIQWTNGPADANRTSPGKAIRMNTAVSEKAMAAQRQAAGITEWDIPKPTDDPIAGSYGLSFYSDPMPVKTGQTYRLAFDFQGGGGAKVWVRGYGIWNGEQRRRWEVIVNCPASPDRWTTLSQDFNPTKRTPEVTEIKVMLYAYWPPGVYWFDNVRAIPMDGSDSR